MKMRITKTLALFAAFCGLQLFTATPAMAATTYTWKSRCTDAVMFETTSTTDPGSNNGITIEAGKQKKIVFKANLSQTASLNVFEYLGDSNNIKLTTDGDSKFVLTMTRNNKSTLTATSTDAVTSGEHTFAFFVRRGVSGSGHKLSIIVNMDGTNVVTLGNDSEEFATNPMRNFKVGNSSQTSNTYSLYDVDKESAGAVADDTTTVNTMVSDANELFAPVVVAPQPLAVWDGNFAGAGSVNGAVRGDFSIKANGNTLASDNGKITISQENGVLIDWAAARRTATTANGGFAEKNMTMLIRYSNLKGRSGNYGCVGAIFHSDTDTTHYDFVGVMTDKADATTASRNKAYGIVDSSLWSKGTYQTQAQLPVEESAKVYTLAIVYNPSSRGTECYVSQDGNTFTPYLKATGLKTTTDGYYLRGASIGGVRNPTLGNVYGMTGLDIQQVAVFNKALTTDELAAYKFPSEPVVAGAKWGNIGSPAGGVVTSNGGNFGYDNWTLNFSDSSGMYDKTIGGSGKVRITRIVMVDRPDASTSRRQTKIKLTQGDLSVEATPVYHAEGTDGISIYNTSGQPTTGNNKTVFGWNEYVLTDNTVMFDTSKNITINLSSGTSGGSGVCAVKPKNTTLYSGDWSPAIEITGDYYQPDVISVNFGSNKQAVTAGTDPGGIVADTNWVNVPNGSGSNVAVSTAKLDFDAAGTYTQSRTQQHLTGYLDENKGGSAYPISITFKNLVGCKYDVYIYCNSDNASGWSKKTVNGVDYYGGSDGVAVQGTSTWGNNSANVSTMGSNVMVVKGVSLNADGNIVIGSERNGGYRGCIAAVQLKKVPDIPMDYAATVTEDKDWSALTWDPEMPEGGFPEGANFTLTNNGSSDLTTVTVNSAINAAKVTVLGASKTLKLASASNLTVKTIEAGADANALVSGNIGLGSTLTVEGAGTVEFENTTFASGKTLTVNGTAKGGITFASGSALTFGNSGALVIPSGKIVDWQNSYNKTMFRTLHDKTSGDGLLKIAMGTNYPEVHSSSDSTALTANVNIEFSGTGGLIFVGSMRAADKYTIASGKTVTFENGEMWPKRAEMVVNGMVIAKNIKIGHDTAGDHYGKVTINSTGVVKTRSVSFQNTGAGSNNSVLGVNGVIEFTQNDTAAISKVSGAKYAVNLNGGTLKADASSWFVNSDIAMTLGGNVTFDIASGKTIAVKGTISGTGNVAITGAGKAILSGANNYGTGLVSIGENASLQLILTSSQVEAASTVFKSEATADYLNARVTAVNEAGVAIPGVISKGDDNAVIFTPSVEFYTLEMTDGNTYNWNGNIWTKGGQGGQPYAPASGKVGDVTITVNGTATLTMTGTPAQLGGIKFAKADGAETASVTVQYTPATPPTSSAVNVTYNVFGMVPTVGDGVTYSFDAALAAADYAWECNQAAGTFFATKRPEKGSINIRIGARTEEVGKIKTSLESVGAVQLSGLLWTNAKLYNNNTAADPGYTDIGKVADANGSGKQVRYAFRGPNTYYSSSDSSTGNAVLTKSYVDDGSDAASKTWTISDESKLPGESVTLPAAPNNRGWQIHLDNLPYAAFDLYFITASDVPVDRLYETPIKLSADGGQSWISYTAVDGQTKIGTDNWKGVPWTSGTLAEGGSYLKMRVSAAIMGVEQIEALEITHGVRNPTTSGPSVRSGLAGIQIVELDNDGVFTLTTDNGNWTTGAIWSSGGVAGKTWVNDGTSYAKIASSDAIQSVTVDAAVNAQQVTLTGDEDFTVNGAYAVTTALGFDISKYMGMLTLNNPTVGELDIGSGKLTLNNAASDVTFGSTVSNIVLQAGTLKLKSASQMTADSILDIAGGTFDVNGIAFTRAFAMSGGSLVNNGNNIGNGSAQMNKLELTGNASVGGTGNFGLIAGQYGASTLTLGGNTLTKTGANSFWLCNTTIEGAGTIQVDAGTLAVSDSSGAAKTTTFADGTISVGASGALQIDNSKTLTVKNVTLAAANGVTANGTLKVTGALDATAAGATIGNLTFDGTPTVKLTAEPLAITTLGFGTDATLVNFDFTGAPFGEWATAGVTSTQMVSVASFPATRLGTIAGVADGWYLDITATGITLNYGTPAKESAVSDQTDLDSLYVPGTETLTGTGGALASALAFAPNAKIVLDPVKTPLKVNAKPVFASGAKIALASAYAETSLGKLTLISWVGGSLGLDVEGLKALVDAATIKSGVEYTVEETGDNTLRQLVLKIGNYDTAAKDVTISQFGDSITEGIWRNSSTGDKNYRGTPNYRIPLMQMLEAKGYKPVARGFRNVMNGTVPGSSDANGVPAPEAYAWHNGISAQRIYSGMTGSSLRAGFMESVEAHLEQVGVTDIITLKIGTNDAIGGETADNIFEGYTNLVWKIKNMRPTTQIYLCSPIPNHNSSEADARAKAAAASMKAYIEAGHFGGNVFFVDGYNAVPNEDAYYLKDKVHPNWNGHMLLANAFATNIVAKFTFESPSALTGYTAKTTRTAETNVPTEYRDGYVKLLTFTNVVDKATAWTGGVPYTYTNEQYVAKKFDRIAYYVENKTKVSPDTRFVWVDMDAAEVGRGLSDFCIPTNVQKNVLAKNLHVYSNSSAVENIAPTVEGVNGTIMLTSKGCSAAGGITGAPDSVFGLDWNDTLGNTAWGIMTVSRVFSGVTRTNHRIATEAQILFDYNGYNLAAHGNSLGIGDFAVHCKQNEGNSGVSTVTLNWIFASDNITKMNADQLDYGVVEIWGKQGPATTAVSAEITDATTDWSQLEWTDTEGTKFTGLTGAYNYTLTGEGKTVALTETLKDGATVTLSSGTLNLADGASIGATSTFSIAEGATLGVTTTNVVLKSSKVTNSGTIAFNGGTADAPIEITGDGNFGTMTLAANTHVYNKATANRKHLVTGVGATSYYYLDGHGLSDDTALNNLTLVSLGTGNNGLWIERGIGENVRLTVPEGKVVTIGNNELTYNAPFIALNGAGTINPKKNSTLTINCSEAATYSGTSSIAITIGGTAVQTLSGAYTGALTVNADGQVKLAGSAVPSSITSAGTVTFDYGSGTTKTVSLTSTGTVNILSGTVIFRDYRGAVTLGTDAKVGYTVNINDCGEFTVPQGVDINSVELYRADGTKIDTTAESGKLKYTWELTDSVCWWDYEFNGTLTNTGTDTTTIHDELTDPYYNAASNALRVGYATPWTDVSAYPQEFTAILYGKMVDQTGHTEVGFGSSTSGTKVNVAFGCGNPTSEEVKILISTAFDTKKTVLMTVPNAYSADHLYAFVVKTIDDGGTEKTKIVLYLDGVEWDSYTFDEKVTLGSGFQIGSVHGGIPSGGIKADTNDKSADLDWLRVYNTVLTPETMSKYADRYPYTSKNGTSERTFTGDSSWDVGEGADKPWNVTLFDKTQYTTNVALAGSVVKIEVSTASSEITMNLTEATQYEAMKFGDGEAITLKAGEGAVMPSVAGLTTVATDVTNAYNAINFGKIEVTGGNKLVYDFTEFPFTNYFASATIEYTGAVSGEGTVEAIGLPTTGARTAQFTKNASNHYELKIMVTPQPFVYTIAQGGEGAWTWDGQPVSAEQVAAQTSGEIQKAGDGEATLTPQAGMVYNILTGTLQFSAVPTADCLVTNVAEGATFDLNGLQPGSESVARGFVVTLNGGTLANSSESQGIVKSLTLVKNSTVDVASGNIWIQSGAGGYSRITLALGSYTLTKTGSGQFGVVETDVTGTGTIDIQNGMLWVQESSNFGTSTVKVGANGTFSVREGKTATVAKVNGDGGMLTVAGTITCFELSGTIELVGTGTYNTITNAENAVADIGTRLNYFTFSGAGNVKAKLSTDPNPGDVVTIFKVADSATTGIAELKKSDDSVIPASYYTVANGVVTFKKEAKIGTQYYFVLAAAIEAAEANDTVTLCTNVTDFAYELAKNLTFDGDIWEIAGDGFTGSGKLTIAGGFIGVTSLPTSYSLVGGKYPEGATWTAETGYHYANLVTSQITGYAKQIIAGQSGQTGEKVYPITDGETTYEGDLAFTKDELVEKGIVTSEATDEQIATALNTPGANERPTWENVVLGLSNTDSLAAPVPTPVQTDDPKKLKLRLNNLDVSTTSGAKVTYKVTTTTASGSETKTIDDLEAEFALPESGVSYYSFEVTVTPAK